MSIVCVCVTVKVQFDNTSTCKYSIILAIRSVAMLLVHLGPPIQKFWIRPCSQMISVSDIVNKNNSLRNTISCRPSKY